MIPAFPPPEMTEPTWCPSCERHRTTRADQLCPVCDDKAKKAAETEVVLMGWGLLRRLQA